MKAPNAIRKIGKRLAQRYVEIRNIHPRICTDGRRESRFFGYHDDGRQGDSLAVHAIESIRHRRQ